MSYIYTEIRSIESCDDQLSAMNHVLCPRYIILINTEMMTRDTWHPNDDVGMMCSYRDIASYHDSINQNYLHPVLKWTRCNFIICHYWVSTVRESLCFKMPIAREVVSRVRVLATTHILVGALLVVFGIADGVTETDYYPFDDTAWYFGIATGLWVSVHCRNSAFVR